MNLLELKEVVDRSVESVIEYGAKPEEVKVSLQIDTYGKMDMKHNNPLRLTPSRPRIGRKPNGRK